MSTLAFCAQTPSSANDVHSVPFRDEDVTTVYDALLGSDDRMLVRALFSSGGADGVSGSFLASEPARLAQRRVSSVKRLMLDVGPDMESAASDVVVPWDASHLSGLAGQPWPSVLGRRVALPASLGGLGRHKCLADILLCMSGL